MFLIVDEEGDVTSQETINKDDIEACDDGIMDIIDISNPIKPKRYWFDTWITIPKINS